MDDFVAYDTATSAAWNAKLATVQKCDDNKFVYSTIAKEERREYSARLVDNICLVGQLRSGKSSFLRTAIVNGFLSVKRVIWCSAQVTEEERAQIAYMLKNHGISLLYVSCTSPDVTLTNLKIDDMTTNNKEDTVLVLDDMQQYVIQKNQINRFYNANVLWLAA
ncbi:uncharacterized protein LOC130625367 [Hydractinia symbiolongicarpus]|uniref:uncharacterized protein LOC130625367 n=1 Tax=Hydractinia symbiolongicarpus TaxID=13093 RepID=UPI00254D01BC|nr:uncharacterized protein LOC130625367 [Hydractinia symbiolongicarpus]